MDKDFRSAGLSRAHLRPEAVAILTGFDKPSDHLPIRVLEALSHRRIVQLRYPVHIQRIRVSSEVGEVADHHERLVVEALIRQFPSA